MFKTCSIPEYRNKSLHPGAVCGGFTLIEIIMVLMVSTLLMAATLKGQVLIDISKERRLESDFRDIRIMLLTYQDKFKALPGDDANANTHLALSNGFQGNGDGIIDGHWFDTGNTSEAAMLWRHLYQAGLLSAGTIMSTADATPQNVQGSRLGVQGGVESNTPIVDASGRGLAGSFIVCSAGIPGDMALQLDISLDDGNPSTGAMLAALDVGAPYRAVLSAATTGSGRASDVRQDERYIVCMGV